MGADNICLKDMANIILPYTAYEIIKGMREVLKNACLDAENTYKKYGNLYVKIGFLCGLLILILII